MKFKPDQVEFSYGPGDRKLLVSLLNEYSKKLISLCDEIDKKTSHERLLFILITLLVSLVLALYEIYLWEIIGSVGLGVVFILNIFYDNIEKLKLLKRDAKAIAFKLEKVIRAASQIEEHIVSNLVQRIELDLHLTDAESALEHYTITIHKWTIFSRIK